MSAGRSKPAEAASSNACSALLALAIASTSEGGPPACATRSPSSARSMAPRFEWRSSLPSASLRHLRRTAGDGDARNRMRAQIFQEAADEIAHVDQRMIGQAMKRADGGLGRFPGRSADVGAAARARDVDAAHDRVDPGRARIGHDDAGRAEDRQAADDAEAPVGGALGDLLAAGDRDFDNGVDAGAVPLRYFREIGADHRARRRIDGRLARLAAAVRAASPCRRLRRP